ncbi:MAG: helix-turn-helix domain-containing protein [Henriciella sp.]|jgi:excisionase family DNA binding protein|nr:helix-turn-helix domain-containing protein [Henriciella sp.]MBO6697046.1 helix-turn-helix domain-containing protein [Henriciella sp.]
MTTSGAYAFELGDSIPTEDTQSSAAQLREILIAYENGEEIIVLDEDNQRQRLVLAPQLSKLLRDILSHIEKGEGVTFVPNSKQLTTQQAADILNVSRPFLIKLLEQGQLAHSKVGRHRRIEAAHLFAYKRMRDAERDAALDNLIGKDRELY